MNKFIPSSLAFAVALASQVAGAEEKAKGFTIEEVIVTAQKREQDMQDIPVSAQAFNAEDIRVMGADSVSELIFAAPSLNAGGLGGSQQQMGIRGIIDYSRNPGIDPRMGIYIDEVYQGQGYSADQPLLGIANVEILRGPQGTLFGKNTVSGAINLVTKQPTEEFEGEFALTYGNEGQKKAQAYVSGGLADNLFGSLSVAYDERDGLYDNLLKGTVEGDYDRISSRGKLNWAATDALDFTLSVDYTKRDSTEPGGSNPGTTGPFEIITDQTAEDHIEFWGTALKASFEMESGYELISITSYRDAEFSIIVDDDMTPFDFQVTYQDEFNKQYTQEFRIQSPAEGDFTWLAGLYYFDSERSTERWSRIGEDQFIALGLVAEAPFLWGTAYAPSTVDNTSYAAFFHADWVLTDKLSLTFGVRHNKDKKVVDWEQYNENASGLVPTAPGQFFGFFDNQRKDTHKESSTSPTIALNYRLNDETLIYGRYSKAAKAGGFNAEFVLRTMDTFEYDQETVDAYEIGLKTTLLEDTVRLNLAAFQMDFEDYQVFQFLPNPPYANPSIELINAAEVSIEGLEVELTWVPVDNFRVFANATWLDPTFKDYVDLNGTDYSGNSLPYAPDWKYFIGAQYVAQLGKGSLTFDVDYTSVDEQFSSPDNIDGNRLPDYTLVNARIAYTPAEGNWELALWGRNLGDEVYRKTNSQSFIGTPRTLYGDPRLYGVTFTYFIQ